MGSFTPFMFLHKPRIPCYFLNGFQLRPISFSNFMHPSAVNHISRTRPKGVHKAIPEATLKMQKSCLSKKASEILAPKVSDQEERIEVLVKEIKDIFSSLGDGEISPSAYDTAWVARIPATDDASKPQFPTTLEWIMKNQLEDGSWGDNRFFYLYDRLVCTLSCVLTLKLWRQGEELISKGIYFLQTFTQDLEKEKCIGRTIGFEIIFPSMLNEARSLGLDLPFDLPCLKQIIMLKEEKLRRIPVEMMHSVPTTLLYSLEALQELVQWDRMLKLQSVKGSFLSSPSATVAAYLNTHDKRCLEYLTYIVRRFEDHGRYQYITQLMLKHSKLIFNIFLKHTNFFNMNVAPVIYPVENFEQSWMVDTIQRLGIDHHFREEISNTLDFTYKNIRKDGIAWGKDAYTTDIDNTSMPFRLLRLHGYPISPDALEYFKNEDNSFFCQMGEMEKAISDFFNLYRFSEIAFPRENILKQAKYFAEQHLMNSIKDNQMHDKWAIKKALHKEIEWAVKNPWKMSLPRLEVRQYIDYYGDDDVWISKSLYRMYNINNSKYLELAKLEYNKLHAMHIREANSIIQWWNSCGFDDLVTQPNSKEIHFLISATLYEPEFSASRIAYTKCNCIENILREIFKIHESTDELKLFCLAINEWKPILAADLPITLKRVFMGVYNNMNDLAIEAKNAQGKDVFSYLHNLRKLQMQEYLKMRECEDAKQIASFEEYVEQVKKGLAVAIRLVPSIFLMGNVLPENTQHLDHSSKIQEHLTSYIALLNPGTEKWAAVCLFKKEHNCSEQDAIKCIEEKIDDAFAELVQEYLNPDKIAHRYCHRLIFEHGRITRFYLEKVHNDQFSETIESLYSPVL